MKLNTPIELRDGIALLLAPRGLVRPDGRPLYAYRFEKTEIDRTGALLRDHGPSVLHDRNGAALIIAYIAEWFRRERSGGHWDWIRPLRTLGFEYGAHARVQYKDVEAFMSLGLRVWRRPEPTGGERLLAIIREAGFPVASVREDPRISSWLKFSVLSAERGFATRDAVGAEAWRVSDRLAQALFEPAVDLCEKIVELRRSLPPSDDRADPVDYLDQNRPNWRDELPFDVESEDIRSMVEQIVRIRDQASAALDVKRHLVRIGKEWQARAALGLSGRIDLRRLPPSVVEAIRDGRRARIFPRPPYSNELAAVAAIETFEADGAPVHELRAFVSKFDAPLALEAEARLLVQLGMRTAGEFVATGGEALHDPIVALQIEQIDEHANPTNLRVLGSSPVSTSKPVLALAIRGEYLKAVSFSDGFTELGRCAETNRAVISFSGLATFALDGARRSWRTGAESKVQGRLVLVGDLMRNVRESVFRGLPQFWIELDGHLRSPKRAELHWRPRGRGKWQPVGGSKPWGNVDLAVIERGELMFATGAAIVPPNFNVSVDRGRRELRVTGLDTNLLAARGASDLSVEFDGNGALIRLGAPAGRATIVLRPRWDAELELTIADPNYDLRLLDGDDTLLPRRASLSVDGLKGIRVLAALEVSLCMELIASDAPRLIIGRQISIEVPLSAFADTITQLLGSSDSLDARVRLYAIGGSDYIADVRWYAEDVDPFCDFVPNAFSSLASTHGLDIQGIALTHPGDGTVPVIAPSSQAAMRAELSRTLPPGPWLIFGRRRQGAKMRPRIVPAASTPLTAEGTILERAICIAAPASRAAAFFQAYAQPNCLSPGDRRRILDLLVLARREGLPVSSIDALKALDRAPNFATFLLAHCDSLEERAALLDLQRDLPFLWSVTTLADWLSAFSARISHARTQLAEAGISTAIVYRSVLEALSDTVGLRPELAGHAKAVFLTLVAAEMAREHRSVDGAAVEFLGVRSGDGARREIDRLVSRHGDADPPPHGLLIPRNKAAQQRHWAPYDPSFGDVIAVPFAIADHASGRAVLTEQEQRRCRDVWLYDPEFFEAVVPIAIDEILRGTATIGDGNT